LEKPKTAFMKMAFLLKGNVLLEVILSLILIAHLTHPVLSLSNTTKPKKTTNALISKQLKILDGLLGAANELTAAAAAEGAFASKSVTNSYSIKITINRALVILNKWETPMIDMQEFATNGDQDIVIDGGPGTTFVGDLKSSYASHVCPGMIPFFCKVKFRKARFEVTNTYVSRFLQGGKKL
jgi:hypothetical protein